MKTGNVFSFEGKGILQKNPEANSFPNFVLQIVFFCKISFCFVFFTTKIFVRTEKKRIFVTINPIGPYNT